MVMASLRRYPDFLKLWTSESISFVGSQFTLVALPLTAVLVLGATPIQMGFLAAATFAPGLPFGLLAGVWVDRARRRPILMGANACSGAALASIPVAAVLHLLRIEQLYVVAFVAGTANTVFLVAFRAYLPTLVPRERLVEANSKLESSRAAAELIGPASAGGVVQLLSAPLAIGIDALSFAIAAIWLTAITGDEAGSKPGRRAPLVTDVRAGLEELLSNPLVRPLALCTATFNFSWSVVFSLYVLYVSLRLHVRPSELGVILMMASVGGLLGAWQAQPTSRRIGIGTVLTGAPVIAGIGLILVPLASGQHLLVVAELATSQVIYGLATTTFNVNQVSVRQVASPSHLQGRVNAGFHALSLSAKLMGSLAGGFLGSTLDLRAALAVGSIGTLGAFLWLLLSPIRRLSAPQLEPSA